MFFFNYINFSSWCVEINLCVAINLVHNTGHSQISYLQVTLIYEVQINYNKLTCTEKM